MKRSRGGQLRAQRLEGGEAEVRRAYEGKGE